MADSTVKKEACKKGEEKTLKGVTGKTSFTEENKAEQNDELVNAKPNSFTWTGKRKSNPIEANKYDMKARAKAGSGITIKLNAPDAKKKKAEPVLKKKAGSVAAVFGDDDSEEEEELPPEAKMRMRNIGRDTPTSAGPNSFNKGKRGFTHQRKVFEKKLNELKPP